MATREGPVAPRAAGPVDSAPRDWGLLRHLPRALRQPGSAWRSILTGWAVAIVPSLLLSALLAALRPDLGRPAFQAHGPLLFFLLVIFSPLVETMIMAGALELLLRVVAPATAVLVSAIGWGIAHSLAAPAWGLVIWWGFLVFSTLYVAWRGRGRLAAIGVVATVHGLENLGPALTLLSGAG